MENKPLFDKNENSRTRNARFLHLFMKNQKSIYAFILAMICNCPDADDIMQETVTLMWDRFDEFDSGTNFGAWGTKIARFKVLNYYRNKKKQAGQFSEAMLETIAGCALDKLGETENRLAALQRCINKLSNRDRDLIKARYEQNLAIKDIAVRVKRPIGGIYKAMARIHDALHRCIRINLTASEVQL